MRTERGRGGAACSFLSVLSLLWFLGAARGGWRGPGARRARKRLQYPRRGGAREPYKTLLFSATYPARVDLYDSSPAGITYQTADWIWVMPRHARNRGTKGGHVTCLSRRGDAPNWSCEGGGGGSQTCRWTVSKPCWRRTVAHKCEYAFYTDCVDTVEKRVRIWPSTAISDGLARIWNRRGQSPSSVVLKKRDDGALSLSENSLKVSKSRIFSLTLFQFWTSNSLDFSLGYLSTCAWGHTHNFSFSPVHAREYLRLAPCAHLFGRYAVYRSLLRVLWAWFGAQHASSTFCSFSRL